MLGAGSCCLAGVGHRGLQAPHALPRSCRVAAGPPGRARPERSTSRARLKGCGPSRLPRLQYRHNRRHREGQGPVQGPHGAHPGLQHLPAQGARRRRRHAPPLPPPCAAPLPPRRRDPAPLDQLHRAGCRATRSGWTMCRPTCSRGSHRWVAVGAAAGGWAGVHAWAPPDCAAHLPTDGGSAPPFPSRRSPSSSRQQQQPPSRRWSLTRPSPMSTKSRRGFDCWVLTTGCCVRCWL